MSRRTLFSLIALLSTLSCGWADEMGKLPASHQSLDWYPDAQGHPQSIRSVADWEKRRAAILEGFELAAGKLPSRENMSDLDVRVTEREVTEHFERQTISFVSEAGDRTAAYLYLPKTAAAADGQVPLDAPKSKIGIVALQPTGKLGKKIVDGQGPRENRAYARELAERGHVVIAPDYPSFGDSEGYDFNADRYESGTMKGIWNHMRCVDLLLSLPQVDPERIATIGHSLGGHNAIFLGLYDRRVKVVVSSCGWTPFHDYYEGDVKGWTGERYFPLIQERYDLDPDKIPFDFYELTAALAPDAFFSNSPIHDVNFDWRGIEKAAPKIRKIYELYGVPEKLRITYPDSEHDFPDIERHESYRFMEHWLTPQEAAP